MAIWGHIGWAGRAAWTEGGLPNLQSFSQMETLRFVVFVR